MAFDISELVRHLQQASQWTDTQLTVTFVRRGPLPSSGTAAQAERPETVLSIAELDIAIE